MVYRPNIDESLCFVLMPFKEPFDGYYEDIISPLAGSLGLRAIRSDKIYGTKPIISDVWRLIWESRVVIADVTTKNPNVNYELGICHALGVPTVLVSKRIEDVPFDYRHRRCIIYDTDRSGWEKRLRDALRRTIRAVLDERPGEEELSWPYDTSALDHDEMPSPLLAYTLGEDFKINLRESTTAGAWLPDVTENGLKFTPQQDLAEVLILGRIPSFSDGVIECEIYLEKRAVFNIIFRGDVTKGQFYMARLDARSNWRDCIVFSKGKTDWQIYNWREHRLRFHSPERRWVTMRVVANKNRVHLFRDGQLVDTCDETKLLSGRIGMFAEVANAYVRRVRIYLT